MSIVYINHDKYITKPKFSKVCEEIKCYRTFDGKVHSTYADVLKHLGLTYLCPACTGQGSEKIGQHTIRVPDPEADAYNGAMYPEAMKDEIVNDYGPCKVCNGNGYTKDEKKPIYKQEIIGYK